MKNTTNSTLMLDLFSIGFKYDQKSNEMRYCFDDKCKLMIDMNTRKLYGKIDEQVVTVEYLIEQIKTNTPKNYERCTNVLSSVCDAIIEFNSQS